MCNAPTAFVRIRSYESDPKSEFGIRTVRSDFRIRTVAVSPPPDSLIGCLTWNVPVFRFSGLPVADNYYLRNEKPLAEALTLYLQREFVKEQARAAKAKAARRRSVADEGPCSFFVM